MDVDLRVGIGHAPSDAAPDGAWKFKFSRFYNDIAPTALQMMIRQFQCPSRRRPVSAGPKAQRRRRDIFVEIRTKRNLQPRRGGILEKLLLTGFENVSRVVVHAELFQQLDVLLAEWSFRVMLLLVLDVTNHRAELRP